MNLRKLESNDYMELDLLEENQIFGDNRLNIFKKYGNQAAITDFAILLGSYVSMFHIKEGNEYKYRTNYWWLKTDNNNHNAFVVGTDGNINFFDINRRDGGIRPKLSYSSISNFSFNKNKTTNKIIEIEYGEYPQYIVDEKNSNELESVYKNGKIKITSKEYIVDSVYMNAYDIKFNERKLIEYKYNGQKYIRFIGDSNCEEKTLSDGRRIKEGEIYWVKVDPITWLVDEEKNIAITKKIIVSGVQFNNKRNYKGDFKDTNMYKFMNTYLIKDMFDNVSIYKENNNSKEFVDINNKIKTLRKRIDNIRK